MIRRPSGSTFCIHQLRRLRQREQAQRLAGRRRVDDDDVVRAGVVVVGDPQQRARPRPCRAGPSSPRPSRRPALASAGPMRRTPGSGPSSALTLKKTSDSCAHRFGTISSGVGPSSTVEGVAQAVGDVGRHHDRAVAAIGAGQRPWRRRRSSCRRRPCRCRRGCGSRRGHASDASVDSTEPMAGRRSQVPASRSTTASSSPTSPTMIELIPSSVAEPSELLDEAVDRADEDVRRRRAAPPR